MTGEIFLLALLALGQAMPRDQDASVNYGIGVDEVAFQEDRRVIPDDRCPANRTHYLLPHDYDCTKFYYCEYGLRWLTPRDCALGTEFAAASQVCIHPTLANCTLPGSPTPDASSTTTPTTPSTTTTTTPPTICPPASTTTTPTTTPSTTTPTPPCGDLGTLPNGCPADFTIHRLLPHETDCSKFYYCLRGELLERGCAPGLHFNADLQVCDIPVNAGCDPNAGGGCDCGDGGGSGGGGGGGDDGDGGEGGGNEDGDGDVDIELLPNGCPADFSIHKLLPHECDCSQFYYCVRGEKVEHSCPSGLHFSPSLQVCAFPADAGCESGEGGGGGGEGEGGDDDSNKCATDCNVTPWPHKTDCDKFWRCDGKNPTLVVCSEGLHFNAKTQTCDFTCYANCKRENIQVTYHDSGLTLFIPTDRVDHNWVGQYIGHL